MKFSRWTACAAIALLCACGDPADQEPASGAPSSTLESSSSQGAGEAELRSLADLLRDEPRFSVLAEAADAAGLMPTLAEEGPFTVFAPNSAAFDALPESASLAVLTAPANRNLLRKILSYHVVSGKLSSADLGAKDGALETVGGTALPYSAAGTLLELGRSPTSAVVVLPDIEASNGVIHVIDKVLIPPA